MARPYLFLLGAQWTALAAYALTPLPWVEIPTVEVLNNGNVHVSLDTYARFYDADAPRVQVVSSQGHITLQLRPDRAPKTVTNFLSYVKNGAYTDSFFHRSIPGFIIQTGGFRLEEGAEGTEVGAVPANDPVQNEFNVSNTRGTIAMAKVGGNPDSATSQWFINLADNGPNLDAQNGGFTVFGEVIDNGMEVADAIAALPRYDLGGAFSDIPLQNYTDNDPILFENLVQVTSVIILPDEAANFPASERVELAMVSHSAPELLAASIEGRQLILSSLTNGPGEATLTLRASGGGVSTETTVLVTVQETEPEPAITDTFPQAIEQGGGWWYTGWYGFIQADSWPWIYSLEHSWQYISPGPADSMWLWDASPELGWLWTAADVFPFYYHAANAEFINYANDFDQYGWYFFPGENLWLQLQ